MTRFFPLLALLLFPLFFQVGWAQSDEDVPATEEAPATEETPAAEEGTTLTTEVDSVSEGREPLFGALGLTGSIECRRNIGVAGGIVYLGETWDFVGQGPVGLTGSPVLSFACDFGTDLVAVSTGMESAPFFVQRDARGTITEQWLTVSAGLLFGNKVFRYGPWFSAGIGYGGVGVRTMWLPFRTRKGVGRGFEARVTSWISDKVGVQGVLLFHMTAHRYKMHMGKNQ